MRTCLFLLATILIGSCTKPVEPIGQSQYLVFNSDDFIIFLADVGSGAAPERIVEGSSPVFSPVEPRFLYYSVEADGSIKISTFDAESRQATKIVTVASPSRPSYLADARWSHSGTKICYNSIKDGSANLYKYELETGQEKRLTYSGTNFAPQWSYDDQKLAYWTLVDSMYVVAVISADGGNPDVLNLNGIPSAPTWLPDGRLVCTFRPMEFRDSVSYRDVMVFNDDGTGMIVMTSDHNSTFRGVYDVRSIVVSTEAKDGSKNLDLIDVGTFVRSPWITLESFTAVNRSPDNQWVAYLVPSNDDGSPLYIMNTHSKVIRRLFENGYPLMSWSKQF